MRIVITGTPATGKTTLSQKLGEYLNCEVIDANNIVEKNKFWEGKDKYGSLIVKEKELRDFLIGITSQKKTWIAEGHLLCEFEIPSDVVVVLRTDPKELIRRMKSRNYPEFKIKENVTSEIVDYCIFRTEQNYKNTPIVEIDNTKFKTPEEVLKYIEEKKRDVVNYSSYLKNNTFFRWLSF